MTILLASTLSSNSNNIRPYNKSTGKGISNCNPPLPPPNPPCNGVDVALLLAIEYMVGGLLHVLLYMMEEKE